MRGTEQNHRKIQEMNANAPGSTLYRVDGAKVCNLSLEDQSYREKRDELDFFMHHPFPED